jgi:hypothetical protein
MYDYRIFEDVLMSLVQKTGGGNAVQLNRIRQPLANVIDLPSGLSCGLNYFPFGRSLAIQCDMYDSSLLTCQSMVFEQTLSLALTCV